MFHHQVNRLFVHADTQSGLGQKSNTLGKSIVDGIKIYYRQLLLLDERGAKKNTKLKVS